MYVGDGRLVEGERVMTAHTIIQQLKPATDSGLVAAGPRKKHIYIYVYDVSLGLSRLKRLLQIALGFIWRAVTLTTRAYHTHTRAHFTPQHWLLCHMGLY